MNKHINYLKWDSNSSTTKLVHVLFYVLKLSVGKGAEVKIPVYTTGRGAGTGFLKIKRLDQRIRVPAIHRRKRSVRNEGKRPAHTSASPGSPSTSRVPNTDGSSWLHEPAHKLFGSALKCN